MFNKLTNKQLFSKFLVTRFDIYVDLKHTGRPKKVTIRMLLKPQCSALVAGTPLDRNRMSLYLEIIIFGRFLLRLRSSTQFWFWFLGFSSILKGTPYMLSYLHIWAGTLSALLLTSLAVSLFGNMLVDTGDILIITKEYQYQNKRSK